MVNELCFIYSPPCWLSEQVNGLCSVLFSALRWSEMVNGLCFIYSPPCWLSEQVNRLCSVLFSALLMIWTGKWTVFCPLLRHVDDLKWQKYCVLPYSQSPHYSYLKRDDVFCHLFLLFALSVLVKELFPFIYFLHTVPNEDFNFKGTVSFFPCPSEWS